jgi:hypothetical protein
VRIRPIRQFLSPGKVSPTRGYGSSPAWSRSRKNSRKQTVLLPHRLPRGERGGLKFPRLFRPENILYPINSQSTKRSNHYVVRFLYPRDRHRGSRRRSRIKDETDLSFSIEILADLLSYFSVCWVSLVLYVLLLFTSWHASQVPRSHGPVFVSAKVDLRSGL